MTIHNSKLNLKELRKAGKEARKRIAALPYWERMVIRCVSRAAGSEEANQVLDKIRKEQ